eukprot:c25130_g3_i1 orf=649-3297(-)
MLLSASHSSSTHGLHLLSCTHKEHYHRHGDIQATADSSQKKREVQAQQSLIQNDNTEREFISVKRPSLLSKKPLTRDPEVGMAEGDLLRSSAGGGTSIAVKPLPGKPFSEEFLADNSCLSKNGDALQTYKVSVEEGNPHAVHVSRMSDERKALQSLKMLEQRGASESMTSSEIDCAVEDLKSKLARGDLKSAIEELESLPIDVRVDSTTHSLFLKQCGQVKSLVYGKRVHNHMRRQGLHHGTFLGNHLINMYRHCGDLGSAASAFDDLYRKNVFSWTIMISAYAQHGQYEKALQLFNKMQDEKVKPDKVTVSTIIGACSSISALEQGREIHLMILDGKLESDIVVVSALVNMYAKCGNLEEAQKVFDGMHSRNVVSWTIMITAYAQHSLGVKALQLFQKMDSCGVTPNEFTLVGALSACSSLESLASGQHVHAVAIHYGFEFNVTVGNALIHMYGKCGNWEAGLKVFSKMHVKDVISWTSMLDAYTEQGRTKDTLQLFEEMQWEGIIPDKVTFLSILGACADLAALEQGKRIHDSIVSRRLHADQMVGSALIHMYGKCGSVENAREVFDNIHEQNVHTWTAMVTVYSQHGFAKKALTLFSQMLQEQVKPNEITFVSVLSACSHGGFLVEGWRCFNSISRDFGITPTAEHYACMVDMLGRAGFLKEAEEFILKMPIDADVLVWRTMLSACTVFNDIERGKWAAEKCILMEPAYGAPYVLLSNIYAADGQWEEVARIRKLMEENGAKKQLGRSSIEIKDKVHDFLVDDQAHSRIEEIHAELDRLSKQMDDAGYVPETNVVLHDVEEELKPHLLKYHSERLAIVFGHITTPPKSTLRIIKNMRVCTDCHSAIKLISKILEREIMVRDSHCFHHFKDGGCSCHDYW